MLKLPQSQLQAIHSHASESYPLECCGLLLGTREGGAGSVIEARRGSNLNVESAKDRYLLDPKDQLKAEKEARNLGWEVLGYYHSHPDHPARPSSTDNEMSWEEYSYVILSVINGKPAEAACFRRGALEDQLVPEEMVTLP